MIKCREKATLKHIKKMFKRIAREYRCRVRIESNHDHGRTWRVVTTRGWLHHYSGSMTLWRGTILSDSYPDKLLERNYRRHIETIVTKYYEQKYGF